MNKVRFVSNLTIFALSMGIAAVAMAGPAPNFTGTWVLNTNKGQNLGMMAAMQQTQTISQTPAKLTIDTKSIFQGKDSTLQTSYDLSGKPATNESVMGGPSETVAKWVDNRLVVTWTSEGAIAGTKVVRTETRSLSADGNTMTVESVRGTSPPLQMVYEKTK